MRNVTLHHHFLIQINLFKKMAKWIQLLPT